MSLSIGLRNRGARGAALAAALIAALSWSCSTAPPRKSFASPESAADSLLAAVRARDSAQMRSMLGEDVERMLYSGDEVADSNSFKKFVEAYEARHELEPNDDGSFTLTVGENEWPLPFPIVKSGDQWTFDADEGIQEIVDRRIGHNELSTIQTCLAIVDAQREYVSRADGPAGPRAYATKLISDAGMKNGLYWPTAESEPPSPLGDLVGTASEEGYLAAREAKGEPIPFHGYYYRILTKQGEHAKGGALDYVVGGRCIGGFVVVAYPAEYGKSGLMTFLVSNEGVVYQRDLGTDTAKVAKAMTEYDPNSSWHKCDAP